MTYDDLAHTAAQIADGLKGSAINPATPATVRCLVQDLEPEARDIIVDGIKLYFPMIGMRKADIVRRISAAFQECDADRQCRGERRLKRLSQKEVPRLIDAILFSAESQLGGSFWNRSQAKEIHPRPALKLERVSDPDFQIWRVSLAEAQIEGSCSQKRKLH